MTDGTQSTTDKQEEITDEMVEYVVRILSTKTPIIYFLRCNEYVKVGTTVGGLLRRIADLQVGNPCLITLEHFILGSYEQERELHNKLSKYWVRGEWHRISKEDLLKAIK